MLNKLQNYLSGINISSNFINGNSWLLEFTMNSLNFLAEYKPDSDPTFFRIMLPQIQGFDQKLDDEILKKILVINSTYKVGKIIKIGKYLWISAEFFVNPTENNILIFNRAISILTDMYNDYYSRTHESQI